MKSSFWALVFLLTASSLSQAGVLDFLWDRNNQVYRLSEGDSVKVQGITIRCVRDVFSMGSEDNTFYMFVTGEPIRDRFQNVSLYCGSSHEVAKLKAENDRREALAKQQGEEKRKAEEYEAANRIYPVEQLDLYTCRVLGTPNGITSLGSAQVTVQRPNGIFGAFKAFQYRGITHARGYRSSLAAANAQCKNLESRNYCRCFPYELN